MKRFSGVLVVLALAFGALPSLAQTYPSKPIRIVVPFPAGGVADLYSRILGARLTEAWGQPVVLRTMQSPEMQGRLVAEGARFVPTTPAQFGAYVKAEIAKWAPVVKASGARAD